MMVVEVVSVLLVRNRGEAVGEKPERQPSPFYIPSFRFGVHFWKFLACEKKRKKKKSCNNIRSREKHVTQNKKSLSIYTRYFLFWLDVVYLYKMEMPMLLPKPEKPPKRELIPCWQPLAL